MHTYITTFGRHNQAVKSISFQIINSFILNDCLSIECRQINIISLINKYISLYIVRWPLHYIMFIVFNRETIFFTLATLHLVTQCFWMLGLRLLSFSSVDIAWFYSVMMFRKSRQFKHFLFTFWNVFSYITL